MKLATAFIAAAAFLVNAHASAQAQSAVEVVNAFNKLGYEEKRLVEAIETYISPDFVEHNPNIPGGGREGLLARAKARAPEIALNEYRIQRVIGEGDMVAVHHYKVPRSSEPGRVFIDIFRVHDGKIVEHWDVSQAETKNPTNPNTMY